METWTVRGTEMFEGWFASLSQAEMEDVIATVDLLKALGPRLGFPQTSKIIGSRHGHMRELRVQHAGKPYRILYAFDPRRSAILLVGGSKAGNRRWYDQMVPLADRLYDEHLCELAKANGKEQR
jgi:hypothetical protein